MLLVQLAMAQVPLLSAVLLISGMSKLFVRGADLERGPTVLLGERARRPALVILALFELALAVGLAIGPVAVFGMAVACMMAGASWVLIELRRNAPGAGCGCLGLLSLKPAGWWPFARTCAFGAAALGGTTGHVSAWAAVEHGLRADGWLIMAAEGALLVVTAPELRAVPDLLAATPCEFTQIPLATTLHALHRSSAWRAHSEILLATDPSDAWREMCLRFVVYPARVNGAAADVVFAVPLTGRRPAVRAVVLAESVGTGAVGQRPAQSAA